MWGCSWGSRAAGGGGWGAARGGGGGAPPFLWPPPGRGAGARGEAGLALAGLLLGGGLDSEEADHFARIVARVAGDEEWRQRGKAQGTARRLADGGQVAAGARLAELLAGDGRRVVAQV